MNINNTPQLVSTRDSIIKNITAISPSPLWRGTCLLRTAHARCPPGSLHAAATSAAGSRLTVLAKEDFVVKIYLNILIVILIFEVSFVIRYALLHTFKPLFREGIHGLHRAAKVQAQKEARSACSSETPSRPEHHEAKRATVKTTGRIPPSRPRCLV